MPKEAFKESKVNFQPEQENKLPQGELAVAASELMKQFENRIKNSNLNENYKVEIGSQISHAPLYEPRWHVDWPSKEKVEINRVTVEYDWSGNMVEKSTIETVTIGSSLSASVLYEIVEEDPRGKKIEGTYKRFENTKTAVKKSKDIITAIPQRTKVQNVPKR